MDNKHVHIIDVRPSTEYKICHIPTSISVSTPIQSHLQFLESLFPITDIPLTEFVSNPEEHLPEDKSQEIFLVCRLGNDSRIAADALRSIAPSQVIRDLIGGLRSWSKEVNSSFPVY